MKKISLAEKVTLKIVPFPITLFFKPKFELERVKSECSFKK